MNYKQTSAEKDTITRNTSDMEAISGNIYEALNIISKRADQVTVELKEELSQKLVKPLLKSKLHGLGL